MLSKFEKSLLKDTLTGIKEITKECRDSMYGPDDQGIQAFVVGDQLDNAGCEGEYRVGLYNGDTCQVKWFNLANILALVRMLDENDPRLSGEEKPISVRDRILAGLGEYYEKVMEARGTDVVVPPYMRGWYNIIYFPAISYPSNVSSYWLVVDASTGKAVKVYTTMAVADILLGE